MKKDVIIIGAGPAGLSMACSLETLGLHIAIIEKQPKTSLAEPSYDGREIALTHFSKHLMEQMGVWQRIPENAVTMIKEAKVLDGDSHYALHFDCHEENEDTLGYIMSNHQIRKTLYEEAKSRKNIEFLCEHSVDNIDTNINISNIHLSDGKSLQAPLIVAADSRFSTSRRAMGISTKILDFGKVAIVCKATHELSHNNTAYECFRYGGTLAVLPLHGNESSIVITVSTEKAEHIMQQSADEFSADVTAQFDNRFGKMKLSGERHSYPLVATYADKFVAKRFAVIGDAAVGMHPVTAHGFNLGLKGQYLLAKQIENAMKTGQDIASDSVLSNYNSQHRKASLPIYLGTNTLVRLYTDERPAHKFLRKAVLRLGNRVTPVRKAIMRQLTEIKDVA